MAISSIASASIATMTEAGRATRDSGWLDDGDMRLDSYAAAYEDETATTSGDDAPSQLEPPTTTDTPDPLIAPAKLTASTLFTHRSHRPPWQKPLKTRFRRLHVSRCRAVS